MAIEFTKPADIERQSMQIIQSELDALGVSVAPENAAVLKRVIHTSADFDYAENLTFTDGAVAAAIEALRGGANIITDTNMARSGVSKPGLAKLGDGQALCFIADDDVRDDAKLQGTTRAVAAVNKAAREFPHAILAVGNAPTALLQIVQLMEDEGFRPSLVIGVPVGFVNVVESKQIALEACKRLGVPAIVALGRKGGSNVAAAICNALIYQATDTLDPSSRMA